MGARKYPIPTIGDVFGSRTITGNVRRRNEHRADERVAWRCTCGTPGVSYVFNLRKNLPCTHVKVCACGHHRDDHRPRSGSCLDDDCECEGFTKP